MVRCALCGKFTTLVEASARALNPDACVCGGQLFEHDPYVVNVEDHEEARVLVARIESWLANTNDESLVTRGLFAQAAALLRRWIAVRHG